MAGAAYHRGESRTDYSTPPDFIRAVQARFGRIVWDLAAEDKNAKCEHFLSPDIDSLSVDWNELPVDQGEIAWLNPPYSSITPWAKKCAESQIPIAFLVPASVDSEWFYNHVFCKAVVMPLRGGRLIFGGEKHAYPKALMLCGYRLIPDVQDAFCPWRWRDDLPEVTPPILQSGGLPKPEAAE